MSEVTRRFGANAKRLRVDQGLTREVVAVRAGLSYRQIGRIEAGDRQSNVTTIAKLARGLGVPIAVLFEGIDDIDPTGPDGSGSSDGSVDSSS